MNQYFFPSMLYKVEKKDIKITLKLQFMEGVSGSRAFLPYRGYETGLNKSQFNNLISITKLENSNYGKFDSPIEGEAYCRYLLGSYNNGLQIFVGETLVGTISREYCQPLHSSNTPNKGDSRLYVKYTAPKGDSVTYSKKDVLFNKVPKTLYKRFVPRENGGFYVLEMKPLNETSVPVDRDSFGWDLKKIIAILEDSYYL